MSYGYGYNRRARYFPKPPTFLEAFLSSTGIAITQGMERQFREKERKRGMTQNVMEMILSGRMPPEVAGTDIFQKYTEAGGISEKPEIKALKYGALETYRPPAETKELPGGGAVTVPREISPELMKAGLPFKAYLEQKKIELERDEETAWRKALEKKLKEYKIIDKFKGDLARENMKNNLIRAEVEAKKAGYEIEDISNIDYAKGTFKVDYLLPAERKEKKEKSASDADKIYKADKKAYDNNAKTARLRRTKLMMDLAKVKSGITSGSPAIQAILDSYKIKSGDPDTIFSILYREANKEIDEYNRREKEDAKKLKLKPDQRVRLKRISPKLEDVEPTEALNTVDTRHVVNPPLGDEEPTDEEINAMAQKIIQSWINPETNQPYTLEEAREHAKNVLKGK